MAGKKGVSIGKKKTVEHIEQKKLTLNEKIKELKKEISTTKYNKRTQHAIGLMKAKLAIMKDKAVKRASTGKASGDDRFSVRKTGDGTTVLLGFPSVGKSTLLNKITNAKSDIAAYSFTTLRVVPGLLKYKHAQIQIIDVPGIVTGAASGRGRGKEVLTVIRSADLILILVEALYPKHYGAMLKEIYEAGTRINETKPDVKITKKPRGGIIVGTTVKLTKITKETVVSIAREMGINNADILIRTDITDDQLIDVIEGNRSYTKALTIITKTDLVDEKKLNELVLKIKPDLCISAEKDIGIDDLKDLIYNKMEYIRIFLKQVNKPADMDEPLIMWKGCTIKDICLKLHKDFVIKFRFARLWGKSAKFDGQMIGLNHKLKDKDTVEIHMK